MTFWAGAYTVQYGGSSMGQVRDVVVEHIFRKQLILGDSQAQTPQDAVYLGVECWIEFTALEWDGAAMQSAFWPYHATFGNQGQVGDLDVDDGGTALAKALVLTDTDGTPAATEPATLTAYAAILDEDFDVEHVFSSRLREVPLRFRLYPDPDNGNELFELT